MSKWAALWLGRGSYLLITFPSGKLKDGRGYPRDEVDGIILYSIPEGFARGGFEAILMIQRTDDFPRNHLFPQASDKIKPAQISKVSLTGKISIVIY